MLPYSLTVLNNNCMNINVCEPDTSVHHSIWPVYVSHTAGDIPEITRRAAPFQNSSETVGRRSADLCAAQHTQSS